MTLKKGMIASMGVCGVIFLFAMVIQWFPVQTDPYYIAIVGPMAGEDRENGIAMQETARLCLDRLKKEGKLKEKRVELLYFNDQNDRRTALKIASQITSDDRILLVIGHFYSMSAEVAGAMYRRSGIPAITASAASDTLTATNDWYFRTIPDNSSIARYTAQYISHVLKKNRVSIIYDKADYGSSLVRSFKAAAGELSLDIPSEWSFDKESKVGQRQLNSIIAELRTLKDPGVLYFATQAPEAVQILSSVKYPGTDYTVIGPDTFCSNIFISHFNRYSSERQKCGYFTDGIYAISPFLYEMGGTTTHQFVTDYEERYGKKPSWVACCYYDAMLMAVNAIEKSDIDDTLGVQKIRRTIRDRLADYTSVDLAIEGVTGKLFFDKNRNVKRPFYLGYYKYQKLLPYFIQYALRDDAYPSSGKKKAKSSELEENMIDNRPHIETQIVYVGFDLNEIESLNLKHKTHTLDFNLWFRSKDTFKTRNIIFPDAMTPIQLGAAVIEDDTEPGKLSTFHIRSIFKEDFDLSRYPFDSESLSIRLYDRTMSRQQMIFLPDILQPSFKETDEKAWLPSIFGWSGEGIQCFEAIKTIFISEKISVPFSEHVIRLLLKRDHVDGLTARFLAPLIFLCGFLYLALYISGKEYLNRALLYTSVTVLTAIYHLLVNAHFSGTMMHMRYGFYMLYALSLFCVIITIVIFYMEKKNLSLTKIEGVRQAGRIGFSLLFVIGGAAIIFVSNNRL